MSDDSFFRYPHTPHLAWLGAGVPRADKVLSSDEALCLLDGNVVVEEKIDGANLGFSVDNNGQLQAQNRGQYLAQPYTGQFSRLAPWLAGHEDLVRDALNGASLILFGEWSAARHSLSYDCLPDWFVVFDVYDRSHHRFWSSERRNAFATELGLHPVPQRSAGKCTLVDLEHLLLREHSSYRDGPMEGLIVRRESALWCEARAKLVHRDFTQAISEHWRRQPLRWNHVRSSPRHER